MQWASGQWPGPPGPGEAHVWKTSLDRDAAQLDALAGLLSPDERARAARFHFERDRRRFIAARAFLRTVLGRYLSVPPAEIVFTTNEYGKPAAGSAAIRFNLSHSHGLALAAFVLHREVGVDVEQIRDGVTGDRIAERFFSPAEAAELASLPAAGRTEAFFRCWTRKEAWIKAVGRGLSIPLTSFDVSIGREDARLAATRPDPSEAARWTLCHLDPDPGFTGALAIEGRLGRVSCFNSLIP